MSPRALFVKPSGEARWTVLAGVVLLVAASAWIESCALAGRLIGHRQDALKFSHARHAAYTPDCRTCHVDASLDLIVPARHASCVQCHAAATTERPADRSCLLCHHSLTPQPSPGAPRPSYAEANFDHAGHETVSCATCHGDVLRRGPFARATFPRMEDCLACHFPGLAEPSQASCFLCHFSLTAETRPRNHLQANWSQIHGGTYLTDPDRCARCHIKTEDCDACHAIERPPSHTAAFRARTHGFHAIDNPQSCAVCHQQDFCEACHQTTEPPNHTASFRGRPYLHCATCHLPLDEGNRCSVCHRGDPHEHVVARPPPPVLVELGLINLSEPCLPCHPVEIVPITHPFNTISSTECIVCHRPL